MGTWQHYTVGVNTDPEIWVTADNRCVPVDDMTESHVRNTLKCILRHAHDGKVWAISPKIGGLRHYNKGDQNVAQVTVKKEAPKAVSKWDEVESVTLVLTKTEAQALEKHIGGLPAGGWGQSIYYAFVAQGLR